MNGGSLLVNTTLTQSNTFVNAGGTFGGTGVVQNVTVNGGVFAPGNGTPGSQMTVNGNLDFSGGGIYRVRLDPATVSSAIVNGAATLSNGVVQAQFAPGSYAARQYTILTASGGLGGTQFAGVTGNPAGFATALAYQGNDVTLNLTAQLGFGAGSLATSQQNVANTLNTYFNNGGALPPPIRDAVRADRRELAQWIGPDLRRAQRIGVDVHLHGVEFVLQHDLRSVRTEPRRLRRLCRGVTTRRSQERHGHEGA